MWSQQLQGLQGEKGKPGRKRSAAKEEDEQLVKKIKLGKDVERNERQIKNLEDMIKYMGEKLKETLNCTWFVKSLF